MRKKISTTGRPFAWSFALAFNLLLLTGIAIGSDAIIRAYDKGNVSYEMSTEALIATRNALGKAFERYRTSGDRRENWAEMVDDQLQDQDLAAARGLLLAAPNMLNQTDANAVVAAANSGTEGTVDDRLMAAALLFLPDNIRARYERLENHSLLNSTPLEIGGTQTVNVSEIVNSGAQTTDQGDPIEATQSTSEGETVEEDEEEFGDSSGQTNDFFVLGSVRDVTFDAAEWLRGEDKDLVSFILSGVGIAMNEGVIDYRDEETFIRASSIIKSSIRAGRITPEYRTHLEDHIFAATPILRLNDNLNIAFSDAPNILLRGEAILKAFAESTDTSRYDQLMKDFKNIALIADAGSSTTAIEMLQYVEHPVDLERALLVSRAGGYRAVTIAKFEGRDVLESAKRVVEWNRTLILQMMVLLAIGAALVWSALGTLSRALFRNGSHPSLV